MFVKLCVLHEESVGVEPWQEHILQQITDTLLPEELKRLRHIPRANFIRKTPESKVIAPYDRRVDQIKSKRIGTVFLNHFNGIRIVLLALRHFVPIRSEHEAVADKILEVRSDSILLR